MIFDFRGTSVKKDDDFSFGMEMSPDVPVVLELVLISSQECFMLAIFPSSAFSDSCYSLKLSTGRVFTQWKSGPPLPPLRPGESCQTLMNILLGAWIHNECVVVKNIPLII